jgi:hypothetical protein
MGLSTGRGCLARAQDGSRRFWTVAGTAVADAAVQGGSRVPTRPAGFPTRRRGIGPYLVSVTAGHAPRHGRARRGRPARRPEAARRRTVESTGRPAAAPTGSPESRSSRTTGRSRATSAGAGATAARPGHARGAGRRGGPGGPQAAAHRRIARLRLLVEDGHVHQDALSVRRLPRGAPITAGARWPRRRRRRRRTSRRRPPRAAPRDSRARPPRRARPNCWRRRRGGHPHGRRGGPPVEGCQRSPRVPCGGASLGFIPGAVGSGVGGVLSCRRRGRGR